MTRAGRAAVVVLMLILAACTGPATPSDPSSESAPQSAPATTAPPSVEPPAAPEPAVEPGTTAEVELDGRQFRLRVPPGYDPRQPTALVMALHGYSSTSTQVAAMFGLIPEADERGFLVALPEGTDDGAGRQFWNASSACCNFNRSEVDDSLYLSSIIAMIESDYAIDPGRVYVVGHSNGGFMAHRLACEHADQISAVASLAGVVDANPVSCTPSRAVSVLQLHGTDDETIEFDGGSILGREYPSARQTVELWRTLDGCAAQASTGEPLDLATLQPGAETTLTTWSEGCRDGSEVTLATIEGATHIPVLQPGFAAALFDWLDAHAR